MSEGKLGAGSHDLRNHAFVFLIETDWLLSPRYVDL